VLWVGHDPAQVERMADRVLRVAGGRAADEEGAA
jgi:ABC-type iron transport system FetAB ATPase subunit